jgi:DNA-binding SARP family transcriptional activator
MLAYEGLGNRAQALRTFHRLEHTLLTELDTIPSQETRTLYERLSSPV